MRRNILPAWFLGLTLSLAGCGAVVEPPDSAADAERTRAPLAVSVSGPEGVLTDALADVPLTGSQRSEIEKLVEQADARHAPVREAKKALALAFADQVAAGKIDRAALAPKIDAVRAAATAAREDDRAAIDRLHDALDSDQREALVDEVEAKLEERFTSGGPRERMKALGEKLALTDEQRDQIREVVKRRMAAAGGRAAMKERFSRGKELLESFVEDDFSVDEALPERERTSAETSERVLSFAEEVLPMLTKEQQKLAAQEIRAHADELAP